MAIESQGAKLEIESSVGSAITACSAVLGFPTIITKTAHGLQNGDVVTFSGATGVDAGLLNGQTAVVKNVTANTFAVEIDTTGKAAMGSAIVATPLTWQEIGEVVDVNREDPGSSEIDATHLQSTAKEWLMGLEDSGTFNFSVNWLNDTDDLGQAAIRAARTARAEKSFRLTLSDNTVLTFDAYVQGFSGPSLAVDDKVSGSVTLRVTGAIVIS